MSARRPDDSGSGGPTVAKIVLEPIFEADFEDNAYGYRPRRRAVMQPRRRTG